MTDIKVVDYEPKWAKAVAEMWNDSQESWGGGSSIMTEQEVLQQEDNSSNLNLYIALDGEKAVGYCSLSEFKGDEGALYIPLLNVRPDYHGKKIGKMLVLKALERTIELDWPRLHLHTWPGNIKAVPLYKKCGFFWEERDDSTHLMNFIPEVLETELLKGFFAKTDWYQESTRQIEVKPDGKKENGFHYYSYSWENESGERVRVEFERKGRGIRLIETDDFLLSATVENFKLVSGGNYSVQYEIINKNAEPLEVYLNGIDDKNIMYSHFSKSISVVHREVVHGTFEVGEIEEEQHEHKTHPAVKTEITINGKGAIFKTGILTKHAANVSLAVPGTQSYLGNASHFYINIESNVKEPVHISFEFPEHPVLKILEQPQTVHLDEEGKTSFPVSCELGKHGFYEPEVHFHVATASGKDLSFSKKISAAFKGFGARFHGESDQYWHIYNGLYHVLLEKKDNLLFPGKEKEGEGPTFVFYPKLGKPFSDEFSRMKPENVEFFESNGAVGLKATFLSNAFPGLALTSIVRLYGEGLVEQRYEIENNSEDETQAEVWLYNWIRHELNRPVFAYENEIVEIDEPVDQFVSYWDSEKLTENWLFSRDEHYGPYGLNWDHEEHVRFDEWLMYFEKDFGKLASDQIVRTKPVFMTIGAFQSWQEFRAFSLKHHRLPDPVPATDAGFTVNENNPVVKDKAIVQFKERKSTYLDGKVALKWGGNLLEEKTLEKKEKLSETQFQPVEPHSGIHVLTLEGHLSPKDVQMHTLVLAPTKDHVRLHKGTLEGLETLTADNGTISIKASAEFFPVLFSIEANGHEWLDHSFPKTTAKSWWNPWSGGIGSRFSGLNENSLSKEEHSARFETLEDQHGNEWSGIAIETSVSSHGEFKGLEYTQYFLMLPGVPVVCVVTKISQSTGKFLKNHQWLTGCYIKADWSKTISSNGKEFTYQNHKSEIEGSVHQSIVYGCENQKTIIQAAADFETDLAKFYTNTDVNELLHIQKVNAASRSVFYTKPMFFMITGEEIPEQALRDLKMIRFS